MQRFRIWGFELQIGVPGSWTTLVAVICALIGITLSGCPNKPAATPTQQAQQAQLRQADRGEALLKNAASQLNDLPSAVDTELRPPVVILDSLKSADGQDVFAICTANPNVPDSPINVIYVQAQNSRFRTLGVRSGDVLKYYVKEDETVDQDSRDRGLSKPVAMELKIAQVLDDNTLLIEGGLNREVPFPAKIEIWRYVDDRIAEINEKLVLYDARRLPPLGWEPAPDEQVLVQVMAWLNQWIRQSDPKTEWQRDPLVDTLDPNLASNEQLAPRLKAEALAARAFQLNDGRILQEAVWHRDIARWAHGESFDDVGRATALFDWTIRNIELQADEDAAPHRPWQTLLYGRGTSDERAWVFALLCRQQGLDVVMLDFAPANAAEEKASATNAKAAYRLPALFTNGQLYLFDTRLGLPIAGPGGKGVATLEQIQKDGSLLRQLDLDESPYPLTADSAKAVKAAVVADPFELSRRASQMEANLTGDDHLALAVRPSELAARLKTAPGVTDVTLWDIPFRTLRDELSLGRAARHREKSEFEPFAFRPALWKARTRHFQGRRHEANSAAEEPLDDHGEAARLYMSKSVRPTDREIAQTTSEDQRRIELSAKLNATYWLGLLSFDGGKYEVAADWLARPELSAAGSPWLFGAQYNLARTFEALGKFDEAAAVLEKDTSPQQHGNKIRARELKSHPKETKPSE